MSTIGKFVARVDAFAKITGLALYPEVESRSKEPLLWNLIPEAVVEWIDYDFEWRKLSTRI